MAASAVRLPPVLHWPECGKNPSIEGQLLLATVNPKNSPNREIARMAVREALAELLPALLGLPSITLRSTPGQRPHIAERPDIGLSISHEPGLSVFAVHLDGPVGVDLLDLSSVPDDRDELLRLSSEFLGPDMAQALADVPLTECRSQFAHAWASHEARLKCQGHALAEWQQLPPSIRTTCGIATQMLASGHLVALALP